MTEAQARKILKNYIQPDNSLYDDLGSFIDWKVGSCGIILDGGFSVETLEALIWWVRHHTK